MRIDLNGFMIRKWKAEDALSIARYANNRKIWLNLRDLFPHPYVLKNAEEFISRVMTTDPLTVFAISDSKEAIGSIGLMVKEDIHRFTAELGYWLAEPYWGRGIMTRAVRGLCDYGFDKLGLYRIFAEPFTTNTASARVLEKAGFVREGIMRASAVKNNKVLDQYMYSKIRV